MPPCSIGQQQHRALLAAPVLRLDPSPLGLAQGFERGVIGGGDEVDRQRLGAGRQQQLFKEAARGLERHWLAGAWIKSKTGGLLGPRINGRGGAG